VHSLPRFVYVAAMPVRHSQLKVTTLAGWQSGHAAACKAVYAGSIPTPASNKIE
jgi:hypothetical protein